MSTLNKYAEKKHNFSFPTRLQPLNPLNLMTVPSPPQARAPNHKVGPKLQNEQQSVSVSLPLFSNPNCLVTQRSWQAEDYRDVLNKPKQLLLATTSQEAEAV